jgi:hypothetical protein
VDQLAFATGAAIADYFFLDGDNLSFNDGVSSITFLAPAAGFDFNTDVIFY